MAYRLHYSDYSTTTSGPPDPAAWVGPPGPPGPPGPQGPPGSMAGATMPLAQPDGSPPVGAVSGSFYNNGGFVCVTP
jgi:hypothetical protein